MSLIEFIIAEHGLNNVGVKEFVPQENNVAARLDPSQPEITSWMGTPVFDRLTLKDPESDLRIDLDTVLFEVLQKRNIVVTKVQGLEDSVKELITNNGYTVIMRGLLVNINQSNYPYDEMTRLVKLCTVNNELDCTSDYLSIFNIFHLVVTRVLFKQNQGRQNTQAFEVEFLSDSPVELKIEEEG